MKLLTLLLTVPLSAATFTQIQPAPHGEENTVSIVATLCPTCERVSDDEDLNFSSAEGYWIFAFEDFHGQGSDWDFNDLIVWVLFDSGSLVTWDQIASYTTASQFFSFDGVYVLDLASGVPGVSTSWSEPTFNLDGLDHVVSWLRPDPDAPLPPISDTPGIPEPTTWLTLLAGLALTWRLGAGLGPGR
jgi:hypothetical protein